MVLDAVLCGVKVDWDDILFTGCSLFGSAVILIALSKLAVEITGGWLHA